MKTIKIAKIYFPRSDRYYDDYVYGMPLMSIINQTEYTEVSEEDHKLLHEFIRSFNKSNNNDIYYLIINEMTKEDVDNSVFQILEYAKNQIKKQEQIKQKNELANKKRLATMKAKREKKEREQFEKLKKKYNG